MSPFRCGSVVKEWRLLCLVLFFNPPCLELVHRVLIVAIADHLTLESLIFLVPDDDAAVAKLPVAFSAIATPLFRCIASMLFFTPRKPFAHVGALTQSAVE